MIYITGDTHGDMNRIVRFCERMETSQEDIMIILGDVGLNYYGDSRDCVFRLNGAASPL